MLLFSNAYVMNYHTHYLTKNVFWFASIYVLSSTQLCDVVNDRGNEDDEVEGDVPKKLKSVEGENVEKVFEDPNSINEETSNSDNDEDSNKSVSSYSSEDSNVSWLAGCEERRPKPPHATQLLILFIGNRFKIG